MIERNQIQKEVYPLLGTTRQWVNKFVVLKQLYVILSLFQVTYCAGTIQCRFPWAH